MVKLKEQVYDWETKEHYLQDNMDSENSLSTYTNILTKIGMREAEKNKPIYNMDLNELEETFYALQIRGLHSMLNTLHFCKRYILWAKHNGYSIHTQDLLASKVNSEYAKKFMFKEVNALYTREEILEKIKMIADPRYAACVLCLFEGIRGQGLEEMANLKIEDLSCDEENRCYARLTSDTGLRRKIAISKTLHDMLMKLDAVKHVGTDELAARFSLPNSPYIFKKVERKNASSDLKINLTFMTRTIKMARTIFNNEKLVANDILKSGIAFYANELMEQAGDRKLTHDMLKVIGLKYRIGLIVKEEDEVNTLREMDRYYYSYGTIKKMIDADYICRKYGSFKYEG